ELNREDRGGHVGTGKAMSGKRGRFTIGRSEPAATIEDSRHCPALARRGQAKNRGRWQDGTRLNANAAGPRWRRRPAASSVSPVIVRHRPAGCKGKAAGGGRVAGAASACTANASRMHRRHRAHGKAVRATTPDYTR